MSGKGIVPNERPGADTRDARGRQTYRDRSTAATLWASYWAARCAACGGKYREGESEVHFATSARAVAVPRARAWSPTAAVIRCPTCREG